MKPDYIAAHTRSIYHEAELRQSQECGCFYCLTIFKPSAIQEWADESPSNERTALCPFCGIDSVIGSQSGFPIAREFLERMRKHWFGSNM